MDVQLRRQRSVKIKDQENVYVTKMKNLLTSNKQQNLGARGALGDINTNVEIQREVNSGKNTVTADECEKKPIVKRGALRTYNHVQSKVNTGLASKPIIQRSSRPALRREESTAGLAALAVVRSKTGLKHPQNDFKEAVSTLLQEKKSLETKKATKLPTVKENPKETRSILKPFPKDPTESLCKLKLVEEAKSMTKNDVKLDNSFSLKLPADIEDIDAYDKNKPLLASIYIKDIYTYLTDLEEKYPIQPDHLNNQTEITGNMRATLIDWLVEVQRQFSLTLETFQLTVGIIDRYLQAVPNVQRNKLQLVGVTAMFLASKYEEVYAPDVADFVYVTDKAYTKSDVFQCEREIMSKLGFCLARPFPLSFLRRFVKAADGTSTNHHLAKYFVDLSLIQYSMAHYRPSEIAAAALCLSLCLLSTKKITNVWTPTLAFYSGYALDHIEPIIQKIAKIVNNVEKSKYKAIYKKYLEPTFAKVASLPQLRGKAINKLIDSLNS